MDMSTIGGLVGGIVLILGSMIISGAALGLYVDIASAVMVIGGSLGALLIGSPLQRVLNIMTYGKFAFFLKNYEKEKLITTLVSFSEQARREGLLALEDSLDELGDKFLEKGLRLVVDGTDPTLIKSILYNELNQIESRHNSNIKVFEDWGKYAPAFGMIGTLQGLVAMMASLGDQASVGKGMALALITTFYGAIFANLYCIPIAAKLHDRHGDEIMVKEIMIEGILSIQSGDNPRMVEEKLLAFLSPVERESIKTESSTGE
jgi:chemotaxis protein MotA